MYYELLLWRWLSILLKAPLIPQCLYTYMYIPAYLPVCRAESKGRGGLLHMPALFPAVFRAPMITGVTTVNESNTLTLDCGTSNSRPNPGVAWFNPEEEMVSGSRALMIENITRNATGTYSCVASESGTTMTSSVTVTVQCECGCCAVCERERRGGRGREWERERREWEREGWGEGGMGRGRDGEGKGREAVEGDRERGYTCTT